MAVRLIQKKGGGDAASEIVATFNMLCRLSFYTEIVVLVIINVLLQPNLQILSGSLQCCSPSAPLLLPPTCYLCVPSLSVSLIYLSTATGPHLFLSLSLQKPEDSGTIANPLPLLFFLQMLQLLEQPTNGRL